MLYVIILRCYGDININIVYFIVMLELVKFCPNLTQCSVSVCMWSWHGLVASNTAELIRLLVLVELILFLCKPEDDARGFGGVGRG